MLHLKILDSLLIHVARTMHGTMLRKMFTSKPSTNVGIIFAKVQAFNVVDNKGTSNNNEELVMDPIKQMKIF